MGKRKYIESPDKMWQLFQEYKDYTKNNPKLKMDFKGKDADEVWYKLEIPLTLEGFENYVANIDGMPMDLSNYFANSNDAYKEYSTICSRIRKVIRQDQIEGGMAGIYNPSITQRLNGLVDKAENKTEHQGAITITRVIKR